MLFASQSFAYLPYYVDFRTTIPIAPFFHDTGFAGPTVGPSGGCPAEFENCGEILDSIFVVNPALRAVPAVGFAFEQLTGGYQADITTIYGHDLNPSGSDIVAGGFDAAQPELLFTDEKFIGLTQEYLATPLGTISLNELAANFPGFDLSPFDSAVSAEPSSIVYAFRTTVDLSDFAVIPEPSSVVSAVLGLTVLLGYRLLNRGNR